MTRRSLRIMTLLAALALLPGIVFVACKNEQSTAPKQDNVLNGIARDEQGYIVPNAFVEAIDAQSARITADSTDEFGVFALTNMPADRSTLRIRVTQPDFKTYLAPLSSLTGAAGSSAVLLLTHGDSACGHLKLTITDNATHQPITGAEVRLRRNGSLVTTVTTDATGIVEFNYLVAGVYSLRIAKTGMKVIERSATIQYCDSTSMDIRMEPAGGGEDSCCHGILSVIPKIAGTNNILVGAQVRLTLGSALIGTQTTTSNGTVFDGLCPGTYGVRISKDGYQVKEMSVTMGCNDTQTIDPAVSPANNNDSCCHASITVIPKGGTPSAPLANALVRLTLGTTVVGQKTTTTAGAAFENLCPGTYGVRIDRDGYKIKEMSITLTCNQAFVTDPVLEPNQNNDSCCHGVLTVIPKGSGNTILVGANVRLSKGGALISEKTTTSSGASWDGLCPGTYAIRISKGDMYKVKELSVTMGCNDTQTIDPVLELTNNDSCCHGSIQFTIVDSTTRAALNGATVKLWKGSALLLTQVTGGDNRGTGVVLFPNRCDGQYAISITKEGYNGREIAFTVGCNETYVRELGLLVKTVDSCRTGVLNVRTVDSSNAWISGVNVVVAREGMVFASGQTDGEGWFHATALTAPSTYTVTFSKSGYATRTVTFVYNECKTITETIRMLP